MSEDAMYTQNEVDLIKTEERFITYLVLSSADIKLIHMPKQYRDARKYVEEIVMKSSKYTDDVKEMFKLYLVMVDNCVPVQDRPAKYVESYNAVITDILAPKKES